MLYGKRRPFLSRPQCVKIIEYQYSNPSKCQLHDLTSFNVYHHQISNIRRTLVGNKIVDNSDVVWASPVGAAPTTSSLST